MVSIRDGIIHWCIAICKLVILVSIQFLMYRCIVYRNNRMNWLEQHDTHTYYFESTSQIIELALHCFVKTIYFMVFKYRSILSYCDIFGAILYHPISRAYGCDKELNATRLIFWIPYCLSLQNSIKLKFIMILKMVPVI